MPRWESSTATGGLRVDPVTDTAESFHGALAHRRLAGFRLYPPFG